MKIQASNQSILTKMCWCATLTLLVLFLLPGVFNELANDNGGIFLYIGQRWFHGQIPYHYAWDNKGPVLFLINMIGVAISNRHVWGITLIEFIFIISTLIVANRLFKNFFSSLISAVVLLILTYIFVSVCQKNVSEEYGLLFQFAALALFWKYLNCRQWYLVLLSGILMGIAFMMRANLVCLWAAFCLCFLIDAVRTRRWYDFFRATLPMGGGFILVCAVTVWYFYYHGVFAEFLDGAFIYNIEYCGRTLRDRFHAFRFLFLTIFPVLQIILVSWVLLLFWLWKKQVRNPYSLFLLAAGIDFPLEVLNFGLSGGESHNYFLSLLPSGAIILAFLIKLMTEELKPRPGVISEFIKSKYFIAALCALFLILPETQRLSRNLINMFSNHPDAELRKSCLAFADFINRNTTPGEKVLCIEWEHRWLWLMDRQSPSRFFNMIPFDVSPRKYSYYMKLYQADLKATPPDIIIASSLEGEYYATLPMDKYREIKDIPSFRSYRVWRLNKE